LERFDWPTTLSHKCLSAPATPPRRQRKPATAGASLASNFLQARARRPAAKHACASLEALLLDCCTQQHASAYHRSRRAGAVHPFHDQRAPRRRRRLSRRRLDRHQARRPSFCPCSSPCCQARLRFPATRSTSPSATRGITPYARLRHAAPRCLRRAASRRLRRAASRRLRHAAPRRLRRAASRCLRHAAPHRL
jgi:hypothetical protein